VPDFKTVAWETLPGAANVFLNGDLIREAARQVRDQYRHVQAELPQEEQLLRDALLVPIQGSDHADGRGAQGKKDGEDLYDRLVEGVETVDQEQLRKEVEGESAQAQAAREAKLAVLASVEEALRLLAEM
jgi:molybdenum-dependent DNA-binding transcriptional regulator ModE